MRRTARPTSVSVPSPPVESALAQHHLPGWDYMDTFVSAATPTHPIDAKAAADCLFHPTPAAIRVLGIRDFLVRPLSLKPAISGDSGPLFPFTHTGKGLVVLGFDDRHLDFRIFVRVTALSVRCSTVVRRNNALGHAYFAMVKPFHARVVRRQMARCSARGWRPPIA